MNGVHLLGKELLNALILFTLGQEKISDRIYYEEMIVI